MLQSSFHFLLRSTWRAENVELNMMFVNFPIEKIKRTFLLLVQRAEHFKDTYIADKNKNVQKRVVQRRKVMQDSYLSCA